MKKLKSVVQAILAVFFGLWILSYAIVWIAPLFACQLAIVMAACGSGNPLYLMIAQWILPAMIAVLTSPFIVDYMNLRKERKSRQLEAELDLEEKE